MDGVCLLKKSASWSPAYINEAKTPTNFLPRKCPWSRDQKPRPGVSPSAKPANYTTAQTPGRGRRARTTPNPAARRSPAPAARPRMCRGGGPRERTVVTAKCKETPVFCPLMLCSFAIVSLHVAACGEDPSTMCTCISVFREPSLGGFFTARRREPERSQGKREDRRPPAAAGGHHCCAAS